MNKTELAKELTNIKIGNWILTGFKGNIEKAKKSIFRTCMNKTVNELKISLENIKIV